MDIMKKIILLGVLLIGSVPAAWACELCEEQQPKWLRGVVHGAGPQGIWDYAIMYGAILFVLGVLFYTIKLLVKPGEKNPDHVKYSILD